MPIYVRLPEPEYVPEVYALEALREWADGWLTTLSDEDMPSKEFIAGVWEASDKIEARIRA